MRRYFFFGSNSVTAELGIGVARWRSTNSGAKGAIVLAGSLTQEV